MKRELQNTTKAFALDLVRFCAQKPQFLGQDILVKQLIRSGTSIGANAAEAEYAASKADFLNKLKIALKECNETIYWLELLEDMGLNVNNLHTNCNKIKRMLISSCNTASK